MRCATLVFCQISFSYHCNVKSIVTLQIVTSVCLSVSSYLLLINHDSISFSVYMCVYVCVCRPVLTDLEEDMVISAGGVLQHAMEQLWSRGASLALPDRPGPLYCLPVRISVEVEVEEGSGAAAGSTKKKTFEYYTGTAIALVSAHLLLS